MGLFSIVCHSATYKGEIKMKKVLREDQEKMIQELKGFMKEELALERDGKPFKKSILCQAPCGFGKSVNEYCYRARRQESLQPGEKSARLEENRFFDFPRLERISRAKSKGARTVFNIQVSGHPSYFANGKLVHNCHLVSHKEEGGYRTLLNELKAINPALRVIGLTATPYRLGHGLITDKPALFDDLIEPVTIEELVYKGYLSVLRSKVTSL